MDPSLTSQFTSKIASESPIYSLWAEFQSSFKEGKVNTREEAYILFSKGLKVSNSVKNDETLKEIWLNLLSQSSFELQLEGAAPLIYRFTTIIELLKSGKDDFEVKIVEVDPKRADLSKFAEDIHTIVLDSLGKCPDTAFFQKKLASPSTFCLLAQVDETSIACTYGTYLEIPTVKFFHINILGRKIEYPSVHIVEKLQREISRILKRFPHAQYLTLCVDASNKHMIPIYQGYGFKEVEPIDEGTRYYYCKKIGTHSDIQPPSYIEYKTALESQRNT